MALDKAVYADLFYMIQGWGAARPTPDGVVTYGGRMSHISYSRSFLFAAHTLIHKAIEEHRLHDVALPLAYLQRHALELALKDCIAIAREIKRDELWLVALKKDKRARRPKGPPLGRLTHDFKEIVAQLRTALAAIGWKPRIPRAVLGAIRLHRENPERLRYEEVIVRRKKKRADRKEPILRKSYGKTKVKLELLARQQQLEEVFWDHLHYKVRQPRRKPSNFLEGLLDQATGQEQYIMERYTGY